MALSIGFRIFSFPPSCYSSYGALNFYPDGTFTHCSCQPSLDAHFPFLILPNLLQRVSAPSSANSVGDGDPGTVALRMLPNLRHVSQRISRDPWSPVIEERASSINTTPLSRLHV